MSTPSHTTLPPLIFLARRTGNTTNFVEIPTDFKHGTMEIKLWGQVELELSVNLKKLQWRYGDVSISTLNDS